MNVKRITPKTGQNVAEYALPTAIIGFLILLSLPMLIGAFQQGAPGLFSSKGGIQQDKSLISRPMGQNPLMSSVALSLADGSEITIDEIPNDLAMSVETVGADGTTDLLASAMTQLADKLLQAGQITPDQANAIRNLSNAGHDMGLIQKMIDNQVNLCHSDVNCLMKANFKWKGQNLVYPDMAMLMGAGGHSSEVDTALYHLTPQNKQNLIVNTSQTNVSDISYFGSQNSTYMGSAMKSLTDSFLTAQNSGALKDPAVKSLVDKMTSQIMLIAGNSAYSGTLLTEKYAARQPVSADFLHQDLMSQLSHNKSLNICNTSTNNKDTGIRCQ